MVNIKQVLITFLLLFFLILLVIPRVSHSGEYFSCNSMDYFSKEQACRTTPKNSNSAATTQQQPDDSKNGGFSKEQIELWAETSVDNSGKVVSKLPPLQVLKLLSAPTVENANNYLQWNQKRADAIKQAIDTVQKISVIQTDSAKGLDITKIKKIEFFFSPTCPYSAKQVPAIEALAKKIGYKKVAAITSSIDAAALKQFTGTTGMKARILISADSFSQNNITAVPVTIIETIDSNKVRYDGYYDNFVTDQRVNGNPVLSGQFARGEQQCASQ